MCSYPVHGLSISELRESSICYLAACRPSKPHYLSQRLPQYVARAEKKNRSEAEVEVEVDEIIRWLTGYTQQELQTELDIETDFETFFSEAPNLNPARNMIKGVICGIRVEEIEDPIVQEVRRMDKLIDELAKGKSMEKILRTP